MRKILFITFVFLCAYNHAQIGMGKWRFHVNTSKAIDVVVSDEMIYCALENGLLQYDPETKENGLASAVNGLSDIRPSGLFWLQDQQELVIGYENGNLDFLKGIEVTNLPAIKLAAIPASKKINKFAYYQDFLYAATDFSIVKIDVTKKEIKDTYYPTNGLAPILDLYFSGDTLFALSSSSLHWGLLSNPALPDQSQWQLDPRLPILSSNLSYTHVTPFGSKLLYLQQATAFGNDTVFIYENGTINPFFGNTSSVQINSIQLQEDKLLVNNEGSILVYNNTLVLDSSYSAANFGTWFSVKRAVYGPKGLWSADNEKGLVYYPNQFDYQPIAAKGTRNSYFYSMDWQQDKLVIGSGYLLDKLPAFSKNGIHFLTKENNVETWSFRDVYATSCWENLNIWDMLDVSINPKNKNEYAVSTYSEVPVTVFTDGLCETFTEANSTLKKTAVGNGWSLVSDVCYDEKGNLWCLNGYSEMPLNVRLASDGTWQNFDLGATAKNKYTKKMVIDFDGNVWCATYNSGLFGFTYGESITDVSDDGRINLRTGENSGNLPSDNVTAIAVDFDGEIWIGTDAGFAILYNTSNVFNAGAGEYDAQRVKVNFEGNVEYALGSTHITDIEVDGGNRKWVGTATSGIILMSSDGSEILAQYTTNNSPLISDVIFDLKLDQNSGELFIVTDKGLISFRTNSSYEDPSYESAKVFPNPVRPGYTGPITIQGIRYNSDIKVTDAAGNLIYKTTSNGGTASWDGNNLEGKPVSSGVYFIWTAQNEGKGKKVGKVAIVR